MLGDKSGELRLVAAAIHCFSKVSELLEEACFVLFDGLVVGNALSAVLLLVQVDKEKRVGKLRLIVDRIALGLSLL